MTDSLRPGWSGRIRTLQSTLAEQALDALVVSAPINLRYLTGFSGSSGLGVVTPGGVMLVADGRYLRAIREDRSRGTLAPIEIEPVAERYDDTLSALLSRLGARRVGIEAAHVTVATLEHWRGLSAGITWVSTRGLVEGLRLVKDAGEQTTLRRAGVLLGEVACALPGLIGTGLTERAIAARIDEAMRRAGFERPAFPTIVASGPRSAHPHARPTDREPARGDLVVLDFGGVLDGYCVDLTRMAVVGQATPEGRRLFAAVHEAHAAAVAAIGPGVPCRAIDQAARAVLELNGLGDAFVHATGHGLGLEVHEGPRIARTVGDPGDPETVTAGMVFTIEPGAYVESVGGVRLEDDVLVTVDGCEILTDAPRDLLVV